MGKRLCGLTTLFCFLLVGRVMSQTVPTVSPTAVFDTSDGSTEESEYTGSAPIVAHFKANPSNQGSYTVHYEWRFYTQGNENSPYLVRYDEDTDYTFNTSGTSYVTLYTTFVNGTDTISYQMEDPFSVVISTSKLEVPNAFSPNGDGYNDVFKVKSTYQSIVKFKGYIFNRWGNKLYEWSDIAGGWDGTYHGKTVSDGVYFVVINAEGADGIKYNIKKDVNVLTGYAQSSSSSSK